MINKEYIDAHHCHKASEGLGKLDYSSLSFDIVKNSHRRNKTSSINGSAERPLKTVLWSSKNNTLKNEGLGRNKIIESGINSIVNSMKKKLKQRNLLKSMGSTYSRNSSAENSNRMEKKKKAKAAK
eukprot:CAMPEP_0170555616 /NCGR_PEP_ID=MMETSP0211-20121228/13500_1 /TAXON_ID=311385 /ORGANISM="Pseudokeronopsis sp., Strain OXSARD2" /LENGTH=125 /DNA_ID=CAMNT_0010865565 /DNA_START=3303 /DNA_END=3680 /DNA_ORIENTATION=+